MPFLQSLPAERNAYLALLDQPALGIPYNAVEVRYRKEGQSTLSTKILTPSDWVELGQGFYVIRFSAAEMSNLGTFFYTLRGAGFDNFLYDDFTVVPAPADASSYATPQICVVSGSIRDVSGQVPPNVRILARPVQFPSGYGNNIIQHNTIVTYPNAAGVFELSLVRGAVVVVEIERTGIKTQITIPDEPAAQFLDLMPPLPNIYS